MVRLRKRGLPHLARQGGAFWREGGFASGRKYLAGHGRRGATVVRVRVARGDIPSGSLANPADAGFRPAAFGCRALGRDLDLHGYAGGEIHRGGPTTGTAKVAGAGNAARDAGE